MRNSKLSTGLTTAITIITLTLLATGTPAFAQQETLLFTFTGGFYDQSTGNVYADVVGSQARPPTSPAAYTVQVPNGSNYYFFGILDQNNSGLISGPGQISNTNSNNSASVVINGPLSNENLTLSTANSVATVSTQSFEQINSGGTSNSYGIGFIVNGLLKLPVAVELATGPSPGVVIPADIANNAFYGSSDQFSLFANLNGATPRVGDTYTLNVTYSDGTSEVLTVMVGAVLNAFATNLSPQGNGVSLTPNFSWTDPANAGNYTYQFWLCCNNNNTIWQIPGNNSNSNGFSSSITSITWGVDPTNSGNTPNVSSLNGSTTYYWQIQASDANGNSAQVQVNFQTVATPLSLPAAGSVGTVTVGQNFNGGINASGGTGPYSFTVNGSAVPTDGTQVSLGDNLFAWNTGGNTLSLGGTPTSVTTVSFTVAVTDSASHSAGPFTYTITVNPVAPLTIQTAALPGGDKGWPYNASMKAQGGVQPYSWSVTSGSLPSWASLNSNGGNNVDIGGTPNATGTTSFQITVTDSQNTKANASVSIVIGNCGNNANLKGPYAFMVNGWKGATDAQTTVGSFVADGSGNISSGQVDVNDQVKGPQNVAVTGTYCVSSNNLAAISFSAGGGTATFEAALDSTGNGHIIRYDSTSTEVSAGLLRKQQTTAFTTGEIAGNYAFGLIGVDAGSDNRFGMAGQFNSNGSGTLSGEVDADDSGSGGGSNSVNTTLSASNFSVASSGRGTAQIAFSGQGTLNFVFYVVNATEMLMMEDDSGNVLIAGQVLQQASNLTAASLNGNSVIELEGIDTSGSSAVSKIQAGIINASGTGTFSLTMDENDGGTLDNGTGNPQSITGDYAVAANGRVTLSNIVGGGGGSHTPIFYLVGLNQAFVIDTGSSVSFGTITPQTGSSFTNASLNGNFLGGSRQPIDTNAGVEVDQVHADGAGNFTGSSESNNNGCNGGSTSCPEASSIAATYSVLSNGRVTVSEGGQIGGIIYIISNSQVVFLSTQDNNATLQDFHQ